MTVFSPELIKQLQTDYIATFKEKITSIKGAYSNKEWNALIQIFHKLAGSGATYMMPEITELSREVETYLQACNSPSNPIVEKSISLLEEIFKCRERGENFDVSQIDFLKDSLRKIR